ncbi:PREDICTED: protein SENESCENCE-ASSOCIATED GENE 21, mitochondrial-like isoform X1 [Prunus mume]|uniref:Protein SENESCENCE-ASSOCIATED GENE 21, mitochondrial-like isoform X1 n=1 Tax=Prunus mume TaxID=102107 RepID=A0ABM1LP97_PRUMU|nr:PREDICTED: protein SENESCENCE-ASSOCIATED GENE 21, mitochondrial-like isoform X1 [Prunus mume]
MAKFPVNPFVLLSRRSYKVARSVQKAATTMTRTATTESGSGVNDNVANNHDGQQMNQVFWMRDPKTGNWIPESHFEEIDVAELREKLLPNPSNKHKL